MAKSEKKVVRIIIVILISLLLLRLYASNPIFGIFLCDFDKYEYHFIKREKERELYFDYNEKIKSIIIDANKGTAKNTELLRIEIYENDKPNLSETDEEEKEYEKNDILKNFPDNNINDTVLFVLDHKYFLSENKRKNVGYLFSIIDYINFIKTNENGNLMNKFEINGKEAEKALSSLEKIDNEIIHSTEEIRIDKELSKLTGTNFRYNKILYRETGKYKNIQEWHKKEYKKITDCFIEKLDKLPEKYSSYKEYFDENDIFKFIFEYGNLKNIYEYENKETVVLNYIIEVFLPVISILDKENNEAYSSKKDFLNKYIKVQNGYFYLFKIEERLSEEGKTVKYEKIISDRSLNTVFFRDERGYYDIKGILLNQKYNEFLNNLKSSESFLEIYEKYGKIGEYETFTKLFEMLDILGEEKFIKKIILGMDMYFQGYVII
mgnify:CR=1 FL=1